MRWPEMNEKFSHYIRASPFLVHCVIYTWPALVPCRYLFLHLHLASFCTLQVPVLIPTLTLLLYPVDTLFYTYTHLCSVCAYLFYTYILPALLPWSYLFSYLGTQLMFSINVCLKRNYTTFLRYQTSLSSKTKLLSIFLLKLTLIRNCVRCKENRILISQGWAACGHLCGYQAVQGSKVGRRLSHFCSKLEPLEGFTVPAFSMSSRVS